MAEAINRSFGSFDPSQFGVLSDVFGLINLLPSLTLTVRRYHDVNKSGWNLLWALTIIGLLYLFILTILKGSNEDNHYGAPSNA